MSVVSVIIGEIDLTRVFPYGMSRKRTVSTVEIFDEVDIDSSPTALPKNEDKLNLL